MSSTEFSHRLNFFLKENRISLSSDKNKQLEALFVLSQKWGDKINISANLDIDNFILENILDPLLALNAFLDSEPYKNLKKSSILTQNDMKFGDIGCGGGYVGLIWSSFLPAPFHMTLIDRDRRKINFCKQAIRELSLNSTIAVHSDWDDFALNNPSQFLTLVSRATVGEETFFSKANSSIQKNGLGIYFSTARKTLSRDTSESLHIYDAPYIIQPKSLERKLIIAQF